MSTINSNYTGTSDISSLFSSMTGSSNQSSGLDLTDYAAIKNGSYGKLMKAYYRNKSAEASAADSNSDTKQASLLMKSNSDALQSSVKALMEDSLWEKKTITKKDEKTGDTTETTDYDWDAITKAVKSFVENYNSTIGKAAESNNKDVLKNAARMTSATTEMSKLLGEVGIKIGTENKLEVDEDKLKSASVGTLKTLFTGMHSFADKVLQKSTAISRAAAGSNKIYTNNATYSDTLSKLVSGTVDEEA